MPEKQLQEHLFQRIKEALPPDKTLVESISELLHVSPDSAYRRIRGETLLVLEEAKVLCEAYTISLDQLLGITSRSVMFENVEINSSQNDFKTYLLSILHELEQLNSYHQKSIIYITNNIPFFYQLCFPPVFAFFYFSWMRNTVQHSDFLQKNFSPDCLPAEIESIGKNILSFYNKIPSTEIWNTESVNGVLVQIGYYRQTGVLAKSDAAIIYDGLRKTLEHLHLQAEVGRKFLPGENPHTKKDNLQIFYNRVGIGDNAILTLRDNGKKLYLNYDTLSYMTTTDEAFCNAVQTQLQSIMRRSTLISTVSEKQRNMFFNALYAKVPVLETDKIKPAP